MVAPSKKLGNQPRKERKAKQPSFFNKWASKRIRVPTSLQEENPIRYVPHFVYLTILGLLYIANSHYAEKRLIKIAKLEKEISQITFDYKNIRYEFMKYYEYDQVVKEARKLGLRENDKPLIKVRLIEDEY